MTASRLILENLIESCPDGVIGVDRSGTIIIFNRAAEVLTGMAGKDVVGRASIAQVYHPPELARSIKKLLYAPEHGGPGRLDGYEVLVLGAGGRQVPIRLSAALLIENGQEVGSVGFFHDLTERKELERELRLRSITDPLTGLFNRRHFHSVLAEEAGRVARYDRRLALGVIDLDRFKPFNDTYGHAEGDGILRLFSETAARNLRKVDHAFRIGGDEFSLLMVETGLEPAFQAMERLRQDFNRRWAAKMAHLDGGLAPVTLSMGVAEMLPREQADALVMRADLAMYEAKREGGDRVHKAGPSIKAQ